MFNVTLIYSVGLSLLVTAAAAAAPLVTNVVLVHGAWVDGSGWKPVYDILRSHGFTVTLVQEPLASFEGDVAATKRVLDLQQMPTILVGHSYGGSIITEAGVHPRVVGLVYVAAHAPDVGENEDAMGKKMPSVLARTPGGIKATPDGYTFLDRALFQALFAAGLPAPQAAFGAQAQVLTASAVFTIPLTQAAWRSKPSWGIVAADDKIINPDLERFYYERAKSTVTIAPGASHSVYVTRPAIVAKVIEDAAKTLSAR